MEPFFLAEASTAAGFGEVFVLQLCPFVVVFYERLGMSSSMILNRGVQRGLDEQNGATTKALWVLETNKVTDMELQFAQMCTASH